MVDITSEENIELYEEIENLKKIFRKVGVEEEEGELVGEVGEYIDYRKLEEELNKKYENVSGAMSIYRVMRIINDKEIINETEMTEDKEEFKIWLELNVLGPTLWKRDWEFYFKISDMKREEFEEEMKKRIEENEINKEEEIKEYQCVLCERYIKSSYDRYKLFNYGGIGVYCISNGYGSKYDGERIYLTEEGYDYEGGEVKLKKESKKQGKICGCCMIGILKCNKISGSIEGW